MSITIFVLISCFISLFLRVKILNKNDFRKRVIVPFIICTAIWALYFFLMATISFGSLIYILYIIIYFDAVKDIYKVMKLAKEQKVQNIP